MRKTQANGRDWPATPILRSSAFHSVHRCKTIDSKWGTAKPSDHGASAQCEGQHRLDRLWRHPGRVTNRLPCLNYRQNSGARSDGIRDNLLEKRRGAAVTSRLLRNIISGKNQPAALLAVLVNEAFYGTYIVSALLQKESLERVQIDYPRIEGLAAAPAACEMSSDSALGAWPGPTNRVGKRFERRPRNCSCQCTLVLNYRFLESRRRSFPRIAMRVGMATNLVSLGGSISEVIEQKNLSAGRLCSH